MNRILKSVAVFTIVLGIFLILASLSEAGSDRSKLEKYTLYIGGSALSSASIVHFLDHTTMGTMSMDDQHIVNMLIVGTAINVYSISHNQYRNSKGCNTYDTSDIFLTFVGTAAGLYVSDKLYKARIKPLFDGYGARLEFSLDL